MYSSRRMISEIKLKRTDTTLDLSQKAEKLLVVSTATPKYLPSTVVHMGWNIDGRRRESAVKFPRLDVYAMLAVSV